MPQHIVFGDPVFVSQRDKPTKEEIAVEHAKFVVALTKLFEVRNGLEQRACLSNQLNASDGIVSG